MIKAVLFDKDGTLLEFSDLWIDSVIGFLKEKDLTEEDRRSLYKKVGINENNKVEENSILSSETARDLAEIFSEFIKEDEEKIYKELDNYLLDFLKNSKSEIKETCDLKKLFEYLKSKNIFDQNADEVLDLYVRICSIGANVESLAKFGAILANEGFDIYSSNLIVPQNIVQMTIAQMASCGMYETSGEYLMKVGIPSKSGVGGGILGVVPNKCGICVYSPRLDKSGNSVIGKNLLKILSADLGLNIFL